MVYLPADSHPSMYQPGPRFPRLLESPGFFLENSRTWKVLENHFGPGKSWKNILESHAFFYWFKWETSK